MSSPLAPFGCGSPNSRAEKFVEAPDGPLGRRGGGSRSGRALAEPAPQSGNTSSRCSLSARRPTACATAPRRRTRKDAAVGARRRASPEKPRDARRVSPLDACSGRPEHSRRAESTADCSAWLGDDAVAPAAQRGEHTGRPDRVEGAVLPRPRACGAAGRRRGTRGAERRLPRRRAPAGPRRGRTARVCVGEPSRQPASRSGRRARAADGCPGGGAGSRGGGTAPATRADCPFSRRKTPAASCPPPAEVQSLEPGAFATPSSPPRPRQRRLRPPP
jgi:hypothetical protein